MFESIRNEFEPNKYFNRLIMIYNWQQPEWPNFTYSLENVEDLLFDYMSRTVQLEGYLENLDRDAQLETVIRTVVAEAIKSSEIEGEYLER